MSKPANKKPLGVSLGNCVLTGTTLVMIPAPDPMRDAAPELYAALEGLIELVQTIALHANSALSDRVKEVAKERMDAAYAAYHKTRGES